MPCPTFKFLFHKMIFIRLCLCVHTLNWADLKRDKLALRPFLLGRTVTQNPEHCLLRNASKASTRQKYYTSIVLPKNGILSSHYHSPSFLTQSNWYLCVWIWTFLIRIRCQRMSKQSGIGVPFLVDYIQITLTKLLSLAFKCKKKLLRLKVY